MTLVQSFRNIFKTMLVVLVAGFFFVSPVAMADTMTAADARIPVIPKMLQVKDGGFSYTSEPKDIPGDIRIGSAIISLPKGESGTIDLIKITGPNGQLEYGCMNIRVANGVDLIKACGGPAYLDAGSTIYEAIGSGFAPNPNTTLEVDLYANN